MDQKDFGFDDRGIPNAYRRAVTGFALLVGVDPQELIDGARMDSRGFGFWLVNHGEKDAKAMTVLVDVGDLPSEPAEQATVLRELMEKNVTSPGAVNGYYGLIPETNTATLCLRLNLEHVDEGDEAQALCELVSTLIAGVEKTREVLTLVMDELIKRTSDTPLEKV